MIQAVTPSKLKRQRRRAQPKGRQLDPKALAEVEKVLDGGPRRADLLLEYLHQIQDHYHAISTSHLRALAQVLNLPMAKVYEVATFYAHLDVVRDGDSVPPLTVRVCDSLTCAMHGADGLASELKNAVDSGQVRIQRVSCVGRCADAPVALVGEHPVASAEAFSVKAAVEHGMSQAETLSPPSLADYRRTGGYEQYVQCVRNNRTADEVISEIEASELRGLGGAGFPTGRKWKVVRNAEAPRYLAVNVDEGEPGTFKDRFFLETNPHRCLEGMLIAAWAVQASAIYIYVRDEYPACRRELQAALEELRADPPEKLIPMEIRRGAGAYICGEESGMIESIEGNRGLPRLRPPYVAQVGLFGRPTLEQNLETLYWVPEILSRGASWFSSQGRHGRHGLRAYSVSGRVVKPGVHIAPAGITLNELISEFCAGMQPGHELYGYFPGGASGGILPADRADLPLDFDTLQPYGCFIGSAGIVVFSQHDKARDLALNAMNFFSHESCGQCTPCRVGTAKASILMAREKWDKQLLNDLCEVMADASICGLGQAAPNPVRCVFEYFPKEVT